MSKTKTNSLQQEFLTGFENSKEYYQFHGKSLLYLPEEITNRPKPEFIQWHNGNVYKG